MSSIIETVAVLARSCPLINILKKSSPLVAIHTQAPGSPGSANFVEAATWCSYVGTTVIVPSFQLQVTAPPSHLIMITCYANPSESGFLKERETLGSTLEVEGVRIVHVGSSSDSSAAGKTRITVPIG
jgi:hypothetical protein